MKFRILIHAFGSAIILIILFLLIRSTNPSSSDLFMRGLLVFSLVLLSFLNDKRYLKSVTIEHEKIIVTYFNQFLQSRTRVFSISEIEKVKVKHRLGSIPVFPAIFILQASAETVRYHVLSGELKKHVEQSVAPLTFA